MMEFIRQLKAARFRLVPADDNHRRLRRGDPDRLIEGAGIAGNLHYHIRAAVFRALADLQRDILPARRINGLVAAVGFRRFPAMRIGIDLSLINIFTQTAIPFDSP